MEDSEQSSGLIGQTISHYRILKKLGSGGMGVVYEAEDLSLHRQVALKFLPDELVKSPEALQRFQREARAASALNHPNICVIHEIGEHEGSPFIVMELMEGKTLKYVISERPMEIEQVLELSAQIADGLVAAHGKRITHRDIKPANIFVTNSGQAKLLDFGLARKSLDAPTDTELPTASLQQHLTKTGATMGTVAYMSPEQARGTELDERTDLFSFGVVLYEMVTGTLPFSGESSGQVLEAIFTQEPVAPVRLNPKAPAELESIIRKALEKDRNLRFQSATDMRTDLKRLLRDGTQTRTSAERMRTATPTAPMRRGVWTGVGILIVALALAAGWWFRDRAKGPAPKVVEASVAVLPFVNMSEEKANEYFSDGLTEELLNVLAQVKGLHVAARTSSFQFKGKSEDLRVVAQKLNVATILEGSVRKTGNRVRITAQLVNATDGFHLWSNTYDRELNDIFAVQEDIARAVVTALKGTLLGKEAEVTKPRATNAEAYNAYLQGRYFRDKGAKGDLEKSVQYYRDALKLDPGFSSAWAGLADAITFQAVLHYLPLEQSMLEARQAADRALQLDETLPEAYAALARIKNSYDWDWAGADKASRRALELMPGNVSALRAAANLARTLGRFDEAIALAQREIDLDPLNARSRNNLGRYYYYAGKLRQAEEASKKALELDPQLTPARTFLARIYLAQSRYDVALQQIEQERDPFWRLFGLALVYSAIGRQEEAQTALSQLIKDYQSTGAYHIAAVYAFSGDTEAAFKWLDRAFKQRDPQLTTILGDPVLKKIESDPRYTALLKKLHLPN